MEFVRYFCEKTSFHGFRFIGEQRISFMGRILWIAICIASFTTTILMAHLVYDRFVHSPTTTTVETNFYPLWENQFPAVTICNSNIIYLPKVQELIRKLSHHGFDEEWLYKFFKKLPALVKYNYAKFDDVRLDEFQDLLNKQGYNTEKLFEELAQPCDQMIVKCFWLGKEQSCSTLFNKAKTPEGFCCSFNWHHTNGYPIFNISAAGDKMSGLTVFIELEPEKYFATTEAFYGAMILIHDPDEYPELSTHTAMIVPKTELTVQLDSMLIESTPNVRLLSLDQRKCWFEDEMTLHSTSSYSLQTCVTECRSQSYADLCKCVPFFYPNINNTITCGVKDIPCLLDNRKKLMSGEEKLNFDHVDIGGCVCLPPCSDFIFSISEYRTEISHKYTNVFDYNFPDQTNVSILNVFFRESFCIKYRRESVMTWDALLVSFGGIFGLCLGGSVISFVEVIYLLTVKLYSYLKKNQKTKPTARKIVRPLFYPNLTTRSEDLPKKQAFTRRIDQLRLEGGGLNKLHYNMNYYRRAY